MAKTFLGVRWMETDLFRVKGWKCNIVPSIRKVVLFAVLQKEEKNDN